MTREQKPKKKRAKKITLPRQTKTGRPRAINALPQPIEINRTLSAEDIRFLNAFFGRNKARSKRFDVLEAAKEVGLLPMEGYASEEEWLVAVMAAGHEIITSPSGLDYLKRLIAMERIFLETDVAQIVNEYKALAMANLADYTDIDEDGQPRINLGKATRAQMAALSSIEVTEMPAMEMQMNGVEFAREVIKTKISISPNNKLDALNKVAALIGLDKMMSYYYMAEAGASERLPSEQPKAVTVVNQINITNQPSELVQKADETLDRVLSSLPPIDGAVVHAQERENARTYDNNTAQE